MDETRQNSTLALLRRLMPIADSSVPGYVPDRFVQLCDGISLYAVLRIVAPNNFPPTTITAVTGDDNEESTATLSLTSRAFEADAQMRKANLSVLMRRVAQYAQEAMGPSSSAPSVTQGLNAASLAAIAGDGSADIVATAEVPESLMQLVGVAVTLVVLSGVQAVLAEVKALPRQDQVVLSNWVRELMSTYDLKPRRHVAAHAAPGSTAAAPPAAAPVASPTRVAPAPAPAGPPPAAPTSNTAAAPPPAAAPTPAPAPPPPPTATTPT